MVEVPEYLLARSRQRRAELTGQGGEMAEAAAGGTVALAESPGAAAPAVSASASGAAPAAGSGSAQLRAMPPLPSAVMTSAGASDVGPPAPPEPDPPYIEAARTRKKMPVWAASMMMCLPLWAIFYVGMLEPPSSDELVLAVNGAEVFSTCASCHGGDGAGTATGRQLNDGEVLLTFPAGDSDFDGLAHHLSWVYLGTQGYRDLGLDHYGDPDRPGGQRETDSFASGMSGFSNLSLDDLVSVVYYERITHGELSLEQAALEEEMLLALAADHPDFDTGSPEEIADLLASSAEAHGVGLDADADADAETAGMSVDGNAAASR